MNTEEITEQILSAWDEVSEPGDAPVETEEEEGAEISQPEEEEVEQPDEADGEEEEPEEEEEADEGEGDDEEEEGEEVEADAETATVVLSSDPEFRAWLARYQGDPQKALEGAYQLEKRLGRQGQEKAVLTRRVTELEQELANAQAFTGGGLMLSEEQRNWVGEATASGNPSVYVREAVRAGEFDLARAVCADWGQSDAFQALRAAQLVDQAEAAMYEAATSSAPPEPVDHGVLLDVLAEHFPDLPNYEQEMVKTLAQLGPNHPLTVEARSPNPEVAARGIIGVYEIARASTHALASTREQVKNGHRQAASGARKKAVVASGDSSPAPSEAPRPTRIGPGLTLEQLEAEWAS